ncbi:hypothetical protein AB6N24_19925 [Cellulomonas sp. 179-A 4D5 NHS]|uniref:hypothetical protein n=1 Tax=Cellulomonas sp. 179-A 4D5 NHS TaxID=3142378 RepID=UPI0039A0DBEE
MLVVLHRRRAGGEAALTVRAPGVAGSVLWRGTGDPAVGFPLDVELEVPGPVDWDAVVVAPSGVEAPAVADGELLLSGVVEQVRDGLVVLRVADAIVLVETVGEPPAGAEGTHVALRLRGAEVYPTGV